LVSKCGWEIPELAMAVYSFENHWSKYGIIRPATFEFQHLPPVVAALARQIKVNAAKA